MATIKAITLSDANGAQKYPRTYTKLVQNGDGEILDNIMLTSAKILPFSGYEVGLNDAPRDAVAPSGYTINYHSGTNMFFAVVGNVNYSNWGNAEQLLYNRGYSAREDNVYIQSNGNICVIKNGSITTVSTVGTQLAEVKSDIDAFLLDADASSAAIDTLKEIQSYIDSDKESAAVMLASIRANATAITAETERAISEEERIKANLNAEVTRARTAETTLQSNINAEKERAEAVEQDLEERKTDYNGIYPKFTSGFANNLVGRGEAIEREFVFEQSGGATNSIENEDTARIKSIQGNTLVWNQYARNFDSSYASYYNVVGFSTVSVVDSNTLQCDINELGKAEYYVDFMFQYIPNRKYLALLDVKSYTTASGLQVYYNNPLYSASMPVSAINQWQTLHLMFTPTASSSSSRCRLYGGIGWNVTEVGTVYFRNFQIIDLTQMFGAGNEPTTVEEFEARRPKNVSEGYNAGQIINNNTTAIKTVGFNILDTSGEMLKVQESTPTMAKTWAKVGEMYVGVASNGYTSNKYTLTAEKDGSGGFIVTNSGAGYGLGIFCKVLENTSYSYNFRGGKSNYVGISFYDKNKLYLSHIGTNSGIFTTPSKCEYIFFIMITYGGGTSIYGNPTAHLTNTGYRNGEYEPYVDFTRQLPTVEGGLKIAGTVQDEIVYNISNKKWEFNKRVGNVDLGSLTWEASTEYANTFSAILADARIYEATSYMQNLRCVPYITTSRDDQTTNATNKSISANLVDTSKRIYIVDTDYTDAEALKTALAGKELYYELANYIVTELDTDISPDYKAWDWGTEEAIQTIPSAPFKAKIAYGFNAVDQIRGNKLNIDNLLSKDVALEAQIAEIKNSGGAYPMVNHETNDTVFTLTPNTFHVWGEVTSLTLTLGDETAGVANEFLFQFNSGSTATTLTLPDSLKWANDSAPTIEANKIYQISILKGLASVLVYTTN